MHPAMTQGAVLFMRPPEALWRDVGDEVALSVQGREEFDLLSPTAAAAWRLLETPRTLPELIERLAAGHGARPEAIEADVEALVDDLVRRRAIVTVADGDD